MGEGRGNLESLYDRDNVLKKQDNSVYKYTHTYEQTSMFDNFEYTSER